MNQCDRTELFNVLAEVSSRYPEWRFGQLIANVAGWADQDVWDIEDDALIEAAGDHLRALCARTSQKTQVPGTS